MEQAGVQLVAKDADSYISNLRNAEKATLGFVDATDSGSGRVNAAGQVMIGALRQVGVIAVEAFGQALRAGAAFIGDSIDLAGDFEQTMNELGAVSGATASEMEAISAKAKALGADLSLPATSAVDAGEAMLELAKAGFTTQEAMDAAKGTLQLAAAAQIEEAKAAEISSNAINAFNLEAKDALFVSDLLAASANASSVEITDVAASYQMAGAIFSNFQGPVVGSKQAIVDLTTAIGILGNAGIKGSDAGTSLKQSLLQLTAPSDKAKGLMRDLAADIGVAGDIAYDAQGKMRSFPEIIGLVSASTKDLSQEQRNYVISTIFGADATRAIITLMNEGPDAWAKMEKAVTRQGAAQELAAAKTKGYKGALEGAKSQLETLQLNLGSVFLPILADLLNNYISPTIAAIGDFAGRIASASDPALAFAAALHQWSQPLGSIAFYLIELVRGGEGVSAWLAETPPLFQGVVGAVQGAIEVFSRLTDAFNTGGLSGLIDALVAEISAALPDIQAALLGWGQALIDWIEPYIPPMLEALGAVVNMAWGWVQQQVPKWIAELGAWGEALLEWIEPYIPPLLDALGGLVAQAWDWVKRQAPIWGQQLLTWGEELIAWIGPMIPPAIAELGKLGQGLLDWIGEQAAPLLKKFNTWATSFVEWIPGATVKFLAEWPKMFDDFLDWIADSAGPLLKQLGDWALQFVAWIVPMIPGFLLALGGIALALGTFVVETAAVLYNKIVKEWVPAITKWVVTDVLPKLPGIWASFWKATGDLIYDISLKIGKAALDLGKSLVDGLMRGINNAWGSFTGWVHDKIMELPAAVRTALKIGSPSKVFAELGEWSVLGYLSGWQTKLPDVVAGMQSIGSQVTGSMSPIIDDMKQLGLDAMAGLGAGIQRGVRSVVRIVDSVSNTVTGAFNDAFGAHSPATKVMPTGENVMLGLMAGVESMIPALTTLIDQIASSMIDALRRNREEMSKQISEAADALIEQARDLAMDINAAIADGFSSTASIDRQIAKNLGSMKDVLPDYRQFVEGALQEAENQARRMADPVQGAKFFKQRSDQILEYEKLRQQLGEETDSGERQRIKDQMTLINRAQIAEGRAFEAEMAGQQSPIQQIVDQFQQILNNPNIALPGIFDNTIIARLTSLINQLQTPAQNLYANPPASAQQMAYGGNNTSYSSTRTYSMPIYTNQSPAALQQSLAIAQAVMP